MNPSWLPTRLSELQGLRAARWVRESSSKQGDKYGPAFQRTAQDAAIAEYGLADTGRSWLVLKSGWSGPDSMYDPPASKTPDFKAMLRAAENGQFDVLVVAYASRFLRDLQIALHYRRFFHLNGVAILVCDEKLLSSNPLDWERFVDKLKAAEVYSRDISRNVSAGLEIKRTQVGDPGGQPPLGFRREATLLEFDPEGRALVERAFELSAAGRPDHDVAAELDLGIHTVRHVLKNPIYLGRLTDGSAFRLGPTISIDQWNLVQARREDRRTRVPGIAQRRCYALKLHCLHCGQTLHGHGGRYRHAGAACDPFTAVRPILPAAQGRHHLVAGTSYPQEWYERIVEALIYRLSLTDEDTINRVVSALAADSPDTLDRVALSRIERARTEATARLQQTRDIPTWTATMSRLDAEESAVRSAAEDASAPTAADVRTYLADLSSLWRATNDVSRQGLALALFDGLFVLGVSELEYQFSAGARSYGLDQLIPPVIKLRLEDLQLRGEPAGEVTLRRREFLREPSISVLSA